MAKMELTEEQWQKLGQHLPQDGDFLFSLLPNSDYMLNAVRHGVKFANAGLSAAD